MYIKKNCVCWNIKSNYQNSAENPGFAKGDADWIDGIGKVTEKYSIEIKLSVMLLPNQASFKKIEKFCAKFYQTKKNKLKINIKIGDLVRLAEKKDISERA